MDSECKYVPLADVIFFQEGPGIRNWQYVYDGNGVNFINIRCIQEHALDLSNANQISVEEAYGKYRHFLVDAGDILMSSSGTLGRYAIARLEDLPLCMNTSVIRFRPKTDPEAYAFVYGYLTSCEFYDHLTSMANGSAQVNFGPTHLKQIEIPWPEENDLHAFNVAVMPLICLMNALRSESDRLAALRDALLPRLMSGEIDVSEVSLTQLNSHLAVLWLREKWSQELTMVAVSPPGPSSFTRFSTSPGTIRPALRGCWCSWRRTTRRLPG